MDKDVIEVEVLSESTEEQKPSSEPKKNVTYQTKGEKGEKLMIVSSWIRRFVNPIMFLFGAAGLACSILYSQSPHIASLVLMITMWSLTGLCFTTCIVGFFIGRHAYKLIESDQEGR